MAKIEVQVGTSLRDTLDEVAVAWKAAAAGTPVEPTDKIYFADWAALCAVLTPKRYELLRHLRKAPEAGVRALARALNRDVKNVHDDVASLAELGLINRDPENGALSTSVDQITSTIQIAA